MRVSGQHGGAGRWAGVVDLLAHRGDGMHDPKLSMLRAYWEAVRGTALVPERAQLDPRGIERALSVAFLAERIAPTVARFRLAGMTLNTLMGMEVRGMPLSALFTPDSREALGGALARVFDGPAIAHVALRGEAGLGRPRLEGNLILLPMRAEDGSISRALGGIALRGHAGTPPRRLDLTGLEVTPLGPTADSSPEAALPRPMPAPPPTVGQGFAEPPAGFAHTPTARRARPHLRVIRNDEEAD